MQAKRQQTGKQKGFFGHPWGLSTLFSTELWERFSFYGMKAILLYYMYYSVAKGGLGMDHGTASSVMSIYGSLNFLFSVLGGWVADRLLGGRNTLFLGGVLIMCGHISLAIPHGGEVGLFAAIFFIVVGTGLLKPNVSNVVGGLYTKDDQRRDAAFSIFYMATNIGAFVAPFIVGTIGEDINFHLGFSLAAIGMALGLTLYLITGPKTLGRIGKQVPNPITSKEWKKVGTKIGIGVLVAACLVLGGWATGILSVHSFVNFVTVLALIIPLIYFIMMFRSKQTSSVERSRLLAYIPLFIAAMMFWIIQEQGAIILATYADKSTQLDYMGIHINQTWFQSVNPLFIIIMAPLFAVLWTKLGNRQPTTAHKFTLGLILAGCSFLLLTLPAMIQGTQAHYNPFWLVGSFFLVTVAELLISPVGLSVTTKLAPAAFSAQTMSLWLLATAAGQGLNAQITPFYNKDDQIAYFGVVGAASIVLGIILFFLSPKIQKFMRGLN